MSDRDTVTVTVENTPPDAVIGAVEQGLQAPVTVTFDGRASSDPDSVYASAHQIESWQWNFGDSSTAQGSTASHEYREGGEYLVTLTVTDSLGASASATRTVTIEAPPFVEVTADSEATTFGQVSGTYLSTQANDGQVQSLREAESGGKPSLRTSRLEHRWYLDLPAGDEAMIYITAWQQWSGDGDSFAFSYARQGAGEVEIPVQLTQGPATYAAALPAQGGPLIVRDTDRGAGNRALDTLFVDEIRASVLTGSVAGDPPSAPASLATTGTSSDAVTLGWLDTADSETGFLVYRSDDGGASWAAVASLPADTQRATDSGLSASSTYRYYVASFNAAGEAPSSVIEARTEDATGIQLAGSGSKNKGQKIAALSWTGASSVVVYRDGVETAAVTNSQSFEESLGKGGGSYSYQVCSADATVCSNLVVIAF